MEKSYCLLSIAFCFHQLWPIAGTGEPFCGIDAEKKHQIALSIKSIRNDKDEWVTKFSASKNTSVKPRSIDMDLSNSVVECRENFFINVQGIFKDNSEEGPRKRLSFHHKCSSNAAVTNDYRTLQKIKLDRYGSALTSRPLIDNEIFTVRIDGLLTNFTFGIGIGVTTHAPESFDIPDHMYDRKTDTWMFYQSSLCYKSKMDPYVYNLNNVKVGQRVGVMRSKSGTLHLFVDGVDQGPAISNIPDKVFGALDLFGNLYKATIVDS